MEIAKQNVSAILHSTGFTVTSFEKKVFNLLQRGKGKSLIHAFLIAETDFSSVEEEIRYLDIIEVLANNAGNCYYYDDNGRTVLHHACQKGWLEIVQLLLKTGADPDVIDEADNTPLLLVDRSSSREIVDLLIDYGADISCSNYYNETLLHLAAFNGWLDIVQSLIKNGADPNVFTHEHVTPLYLAVAQKHKDVVTLLVKSGANVNWYNRFPDEPDCPEDASCPGDMPQSAIQVAADTGCLDIVQFLLENGADPNDVTTAGYTPLHFAAKLLNKDVVALLLDRGANVNSCTSLLWTSLHFAAETGCPEIVQLLVEKGADPSATVVYEYSPIYVKSLCPPHHEFTPLHIAVLNSHKEVVSLFIDLGGNVNSLVSEGWTTLHLAAATNCPEMVQFLLEKGVNPNATANEDITPLHVAVVNSNIEIAALLINAGANVNSFTFRSELTSIHFAAILNATKMVKFLIKSGADPCAFARNGYTPLHMAVVNSREQVVSLLISFGINVNICNEDNFTPLHCAIETGCLKMVKLLVKKGADLDAKDSEGLTALSIACCEIIEPTLERKKTGKYPVGIFKYLLKATNIKDGRSDTPLNFIIRNLPDLKLVKMFLRRGGFFTFVDFCKLLRAPELKQAVLQNIEICTDSIVNKFNNNDLPELYKLPMSADILPLKRHMLITRQGMIEDIKQSVRNEIEIKGYCNIIKPRIILLRIIAVRSYINYFAGYKKKSQLKRSVTSDSNVQLCSSNKIRRVIYHLVDTVDWR